MIESVGALVRVYPACAGEPPVAYPSTHHAGSIPACAGEPLACRALWAFVPVYPRVCGGAFSPSRFRAL